MNTSEWIAVGGIAAGLFSTTIGSALYLSYKIGALNEKVLSIEKIVHALSNTVTEIRIEMAEMQVKLEILWKTHVSKSNSPVTLNDAGHEILTKTNIGTFADEHYPEILSKVKALNPENAYQAQEVLLAVVGRYKRNDECKFKLQQTAFACGYDIDSMLLVAALSIRDRVISDL